MRVLTVKKGFDRYAMRWLAVKLAEVGLASKSVFAYSK
jgi:hypothetical protein